MATIGVSIPNSRRELWRATRDFRCPWARFCILSLTSLPLPTYYFRDFHGFSTTALLSDERPPHCPLWHNVANRTSLEQEAMGSFGERMQREREMRTITLDEIAESTKIGTRM